MAGDISETDWKVYRSLHPVALQRYCDRVLAEVSALVSDTTKTPHERYLALYQMIQDRDERLDQVFDYLRRSTARRQLGQMRLHGLISDEEFARFEPESRRAAEAWVSMQRD
jgi:hypothetical protein